MADLVIAHFNEFVAAASLGDDLQIDSANGLSPYAPNGVYPTVDGWIALSVDGVEQWAQCAQVLGSDMTDDARIAELTGTHLAAELAAAFRAVGVPAEKVATPADLLESAQLASRGFFTPVEHGEWGTAPGRCSVATVRRAADRAGRATAPGADGRRRCGLTMVARTPRAS